MLTKSFLNKYFCKQDGGFMLELALLTPILTMVTFGTLEYMNVLKTQQKITQVARDAAVNVKLDCKNQEDIEGCMAPHQQLANKLANSSIKDFDTRGAIVLHYYRFTDENRDRRVGEDEITYSEFGECANIPDPDDPLSSADCRAISDFNDAGLKFTGVGSRRGPQRESQRNAAIFKDLLLRYSEDVVVAEVFYSYKPITTYSIITDIIKDGGDPKRKGIYYDSVVA